MRWVYGNKVIGIDEYDYSQFNKMKTVKKSQGRNHNRKRYCQKFLTFDIETTRIPDIEQSFMYIWQCSDGDVCIVGRTWEEWFEFLKRIRKQLVGRWVVIYVHNLSFEGHFLSGWYDFEDDEVFATDPRKILKMTMFDCFEYRCSFYLSNMKLETYLKTYGVKNLKTTLDYDQMRFPDDELNDDEMLYCINDVIGLHQAIEKQMELMNVNLWSIPMTSTGFVRKDIKDAMKKYNHKQLQSMQPNEQIYKMLFDAFRGGNTHANRFYSDEILENVTSYDRVSSYPDVMMNHLFPMKKFQITAIRDMKRVIELINRNKSVLVEIGFFNIDLKNIMYGCPYLSQHKCRSIKNPVLDNGRIIRADYLETTLTDVDLRILLDIYKFDDVRIIQCAFSNYKPLPVMYRDVIMKYYRDKTKLKHGDPIMYAIAKALLNANYGMSVMNIAKQSIRFNGGSYTEETKPLSDLLNKNRKRAFSFYAWGVWISAWARFELHRMIQLTGSQFVYCDTDSVKYIGDVDFSGYNAEQKEKCIRNGAYADDTHGNRYYLGMLDLDGQYAKFKTMGAKKYAYVEQDGSLHVTIAGVNKKEGAKELSSHGGLDAMRSGFIFVDSGGNDAVYNDENYGEWTDGKHHLYITKNITIRKSSYTLGLTDEYVRILKYSKKLKYDPYGFNRG